MFSRQLFESNVYNMKKKVGIVLPLWNQKKEYIFECLEAIEFQDFRDFKLVIVIDGANIETVYDVVAAAKQLSISYKIVFRDVNKGIAFSLNEGFSYLENCEYLTWVSSDNKQYKNYLSVLVSEIENSDDDVVLVYSLFNLINENSDTIGDSNRLKFMTEFMHRPKEQILQNCFIGPSFLFKRETFIKCGRYNPEFESVEDYEFWIRLIKQGNIKFVPTLLMDYRLGGEFSYTTRISSEKISIKSAEAIYKNRLLEDKIPNVTVIISAYNEESYILQCLNSVLSQTYENFQLIFIDDASTDNTWFRINQLFDKRIMPIKLNTNIGKAEAINLALKYSLGKFILELDGDDWLQPNTLELMVNKMESLSENYAMCYANRKIWFDTNGELTEGPTYYGIEYKDKYEVIKKITTHCPRLYRKTCLDSVGGWPSNNINGERNIVEDINLMLNLASEYEFYYINETLYNQRRHNDNLTKTKIDKCTKQIESLVTEKLFEWGDLYKPSFSYNGPWIGAINLTPKH